MAKKQEYYSAGDGRKNNRTPDPEQECVYTSNISGETITCKRKDQPKAGKNHPHERWAECCNIALKFPIPEKEVKEDK